MRAEGWRFHSRWDHFKRKSQPGPRDGVQSGLQLGKKEARAGLIAGQHSLASI